MKIPGLKKQAQEKVNAALKRARGAGAKFARGGVGSAYSAATGAGCFYVAKMATDVDAATGKPKIEFLAKQPYALPVAFAVAGHLVKRRQMDVGAAMLGAAGFLAAQAYGNASAKKAGALDNPNAPDMKKALGAEGYGYGGAHGYYGSAYGLDAGAVIHPALMTGAAGHLHPSYGMSAGEAGGVIEPASASSFMSLSDV